MRMCRQLVALRQSKLKCPFQALERILLLMSNKVASSSLSSSVQFSHSCILLQRHRTRPLSTNQMLSFLMVLPIPSLLHYRFRFMVIFSSFRVQVSNFPLPMLPYSLEMVPLQCRYRMLWLMNQHRRMQEKECGTRLKNFRYIGIV